MTYRILLVCLVALCPILAAGSALAHEPTNGTAKLYADSVVLDYRFGGTYPAWVNTAIRTALETDYPNRTYNNSRMPTFAYSSAGSGAVVFSGASVSPCGTGNPDWLQCAKGGGTDTWRIYIRNFRAAPHGSWWWYSETGSCPAGKTCWDARRALIHEILHITMSADHDSQGESNTVMASVTPWYAHTGWNTHHIQRCDEAAAQLLYDLASTAGVYADCYDHIPGAVEGKLDSAVTVQYTSYSACVGVPFNIYGRAAVMNTTNYKRLANNPLTNRVVRFDRKPHSGTTWTLNVGSTTASNAAGYNWVEDFSAGAPGVWDFRAHYDGETGVDNDLSPVFTVTWRAC
jgi:predicted secreted protein